MKIALIGTIINDLIKHYDGTQSKSLGGLLYTINAVRSLLDQNDCIIPICMVGQDIYPEVITILKDDPSVILDGLKKCNQTNNTVELTYTSPDERIERSLHPLPPLQFEDIRPYINVDALLINLISGWELNLDTFSKIREVYSGLIYLDIHSLALGRKQNGTRYYRMISHVKQWISNCDILQLNEAEFDIINKENKTCEVFFTDCCANEEKIINLTRGSRGSTTYIKEKNIIHKLDVYPAAGINVIDPTGCGDAFMAGFVIEYLKSKNISRSAGQANHVAALMGTFKRLPHPEFLRHSYSQFNKEN